MNRRTLKTLLIVFLALAPFALLVSYTAKYAVDVPFFDAWAMVPFLEKSYEGSLTFSDYLDQHNESRILFPRLIMIPLARLTGWDTRYEMGAILLTALLTFLLLANQAMRTSIAVRGKSTAWLAIPISILIFSVLQHECWTFGFTLIGYMNVLFVVAGFSLLAQERLTPICLAGAMLAGTIATYSYANGIFFWIPGLFMLFSGGRKRKSQYVAWIMFAIALLSTYFATYEKPSFAVPLWHSLGNIRNFSGYLFAFLGGGIVNIPNAHLAWSITIGAIGFAVFLGGSLACCLMAGRTLKAAGLWIALGIYVLLSALAAASGRSGYGIHQALASRYTLFSSLFWISIIVISNITIGQLVILHLAGLKNQDLSSARSTRIKLIFLKVILVIFAIVCAGLFLISSRHAIGKWDEYSFLQRAIRNELLSCRPFSKILLRTFPVPIPEKWVEFLTRHDLSVFRDKRIFSDYKPVDMQCGSVDSIQGDWLPDKIFPAGAFQISGRAHDPDSGQSVTAVLFVNTDRLIIGRCDVALDRDSIWTYSLPGEKLPLGISTLDVYALLKDSSRIAQIGTLNVEKIPLSEIPAIFQLKMIDKPDAVAGYMDEAGCVADLVKCRGWARDAATGGPGQWIIVTDESTNILAYCRTGDARNDVATHYGDPRMLPSGWHAIFHKTMLGEGDHVLKAYLVLPEAGKALKLNNDFELTIEP